MTGDFMDMFVATGSGDIRNPTALKFGPDGDLYVDSRASSRVLRYDRTIGVFLDTFIPQGTAD
jgi:hypothetical protein